MGEKRHRKFTAERKLDIVIAGLKSGNVQEVCRRQDISSALYYSRCGQVQLEIAGNFLREWE